MTADKIMLKFEDLTYKIRGCFFKVYNELGPGFKEIIYHNAIAVEFEENKLLFEDIRVNP